MAMFNSVEVSSNALTPFIVTSPRYLRSGESDFAVTSEQVWYLQTKPDVCRVDGDIAAGVDAVREPVRWAAAPCTHCDTVSTLQTIEQAINFKL